MLFFWSLRTRYHRYYTSSVRLLSGLGTIFKLELIQMTLALFMNHICLPPQGEIDQAKGDLETL